MAIELTATAERISQETNLKNNIILEIDGIDLIFGSQPIFRVWRIGEDNLTIGQQDLVIGGLVKIENSRDYIMLEGTTNNITQQLEVDQGGAGSVSRFNIQMTDKDQELTQLFSPGSTLPDIMGREATVYLSFEGGSHPQDSIRIFNGIIDQQKTPPGSWGISVAHPQTLTRTDLFNQVSANLTADITDTDTFIAVDSTEGFLSPVDTIRSLIRIEDELIEVGSITPTGFNVIQRGAEGTAANAHDNEEECQSYYIIEDNPIDIALKVMLSRGGTPAYSDISPNRFVQTIGLQTIPDAIIFDSTNFQDEFGLAEGDLISITGASNIENNVTDVAITSFIVGPFGTAVVIGGAGLVEETDTSSLLSIRSQFDVYPFENGRVSAACGMLPRQVDVQRHIDLRSLLIAQIPEMKIFIDETQTAKDFIVDELFKPIGFYQIPKARYSVAAVIPPLVTSRLKRFDFDAVKNPDKVFLTREINKNFYNSITFRFNPDPLNLSRFLSGEIFYSQRSLNRIETNTRSLTIDSRGLTGDPITENRVESLARRLQDRWQFAPETTEIEVKFKDGFNVEVSDIVLFGDSDLQITDINQANRSFTPRLMEVINKSVNLKTGDAKFKLLDTAAGADGRFSVIAPSSFVGEGSTNTEIILKPSFGTGEFELEREKWESFIGENVLIRSFDYSFQEEVRLVGFSESSLFGLQVDALSISVPEGYVVDLPFYSDSADSGVIAKSAHAFLDPQVKIVSNSLNDTSFEVDPALIDRFLVDAFVRVHSPDYSEDSISSPLDDDLQVTDVDTGTNIITVNRSIGFIPQTDYEIDLIGFRDGGLPYRLL